MKKFSLIKVLSLSLVLLMTSPFFTSCNKDTEGCTNPDATNYEADATIDDGSCIVDMEVEGCMDDNATNYNTDATIDDDSCEYPATPFLGNYSAVETCNFGEDTYSMVIAADQFDQIATISIQNFYNTINVTALVDGNNITIEEQTGGTNFTVEGSGTLVGDILTINFTLISGSITDECIIIATQQ